ncbi:MAG: CoA pyrophosphatase [Saprospiraceae bacterium]|nr:CoA pyrophosphatase [Saprospiraceae bacterium]
MQQHFILQMEQSLKQPLLGFEAQLKMSHPFRKDYPIFSENAKIAAVLILFYPKGQEWYIPLIQRQSNNPRDRHGGQISFPGGRLEGQDESLMHTALREAEEEIGVCKTDVCIIGKLSEIYIPVSNFLVHPFVGYLNYTPDFQLQISEVEGLVEANFHTFTCEENIKLTDMPFVKGTLENVPYFDVNGQVVWGATAMIMSELLQLWNGSTGVSLEHSNWSKWN